MMRIAYADPPYPGCAHLYKDHPDFAGEVDYSELARRLATYDGFVLHTASTTLDHIYDCLRGAGMTGYRTMAWVKPFAAFKRNVSVAYAWEPVIVSACRKPVVTKEVVMRDWRNAEEVPDWIAESITMKKGLTGAKPIPVIEWAFHVVGALPEDTLDDLYPGTGIVGETWKKWAAR